MPNVVRPLRATLYHFVCGRSLCRDFGNTFLARFYFFRLYSLLHFAEISVLLMLSMDDSAIVLSIPACPRVATQVHKVWPQSTEVPIIDQRS